jgi:hypothetical protein
LIPQLQRHSVRRSFLLFPAGLRWPGVLIQTKPSFVNNLMPIILLFNIKSKDNCEF